MNVCKLKMDAASGHSELQECFANATGPGGTPGETIITLTPNQPITYHGTSGFPGEKVFSYFLRYSGGVDCAIRLVELHWRRQISPAPAAASFDDVPISHPYFRHIEALFDSGITAGCNETPLRFCPERPITRGEMAVFLTKALGLHWPWDAEP